MSDMKRCVRCKHYDVRYEQIGAYAVNFVEIPVCSKMGVDIGRCVMFQFIERRMYACGRTAPFYEPIDTPSTE